MAATFLWRGSGSALDVAADWTEPALGPGPAPTAPGPADTATIDSTGALDATGTLTVASLSLDGELGLAGAAAIAVGGAAAQPGTITIGTTGTLAGTGRIDAPLALAGQLAASGGVLALFAPAGGNGTLAISAGATLFAADALGAGLRVAFQGSGGTLELFTTAAPCAAAIAGFAAGDAIDIADATITAATWNAGTLTLTDTGGGTLALALSGSFTAMPFVALPDGMGGSVIRLATPTALPASAATLTLDGVYAGSGSADIVQATGTVALMGDLHAGTLAATGLLTVLPGGTLSAGIFSLAGTLTAEGAVALGSATTTPGMLAIGAAATLAGSGRIDAALTVDGVLDANGGALGLFGDAVGSGTLAIGAGATLFASGSIGPGLTVAFAPGATLDLAAPADFAGTLAGLGAGDAIDLGFASGLAGQPVAAQLAGRRVTTVPDGTGGTLIEVACYAAGTRLATPAGEVPVEALRVGDGVLALDEGAWVARRVRWIGRATIDPERHPQPERAAPIRIGAHAIAPHVPRRDLLVSPDHAIFLDGALVQAQALLNGATITQVFLPRVTYLHVELDRHAVLLAEGLPAESYLDTGNRTLFAGGAAALAAAIAWDERACAPLLLGGARVAAAHARLLNRAQALGFTLTEEAGLSVRVDGCTARLISRSFVPAWLALNDDRRRLGVAVAAVRLNGHRLPQAAFGRGWHAPEPGWRWTDGDAVLHLPHAGHVSLSCAPVAARYWAEPASRHGHHGFPLAAAPAAAHDSARRAAWEHAP